MTKWTATIPPMRATRADSGYSGFGIWTALQFRMPALTIRNGCSTCAQTPTDTANPKATAHTTLIRRSPFDLEILTHDGSLFTCGHADFSYQFFEPRVVAQRVVGGCDIDRCHKALA